MDLRQLTYFLQVANHGGFNRAASHLHVAQSALSRQVTLLEAELNTPLFIRGSGGVDLTAAGKILQSRAEAILAYVRVARDEVMAEAHEVRGELALGMPPSLDGVMTVPVLNEMRRRHPAVVVKTWVALSIELRDRVLDGTLDMAVIGVVEPEPILASAPLFDDAMYLIGPAGSDLPEVADWDAVARLPLILTSPPNSVRMLVERAAVRAGHRLNTVMEVNYVPVLMALVAQGAGCTLLPKSALSTLSALAYTAAPLRDLAYQWVVVHSKERELSAAGSALQRIMIEQAPAGNASNGR